MRSLKRISALFIAIAMVLSLVSFSAFAEEKYSISYTFTNEAGEEITSVKPGVPFYVEATLPADTYANIALKFDAGTGMTVDKDADVTVNYGGTKGNYAGVYAVWTSFTTVTDDTPLLKVKMTIPANTAVGDFDVLKPVSIGYTVTTLVVADKTPATIEVEDGRYKIAYTFTNEAGEEITSVKPGVPFYVEATLPADTYANIALKFDAGTGMTVDKDADVTVNYGGTKGNYAGVYAVWTSFTTVTDDTPLLKVKMTIPANTAVGDFDVLKPVSIGYTVTALVVADKTPATITVLDSFTAITDGLLAPVDTIEMRATEVDEEVVVESFDLAINKGNFEDVIAIKNEWIAVDNEAIDTTKVGTYDDAVIITIPADTPSKNGQFVIAEETVIKVAVDIIGVISPVISVSNIEAKPGNEIEVTVNIEKNAGFADLNIEIGYDESVMELVNVEPAEGIAGIFTPAEDNNVNPFNMSWDSESNIKYNGVLATLTFVLKDDAAVGLYPITVDYYKGINNDYVDGEDVNYDENERPIAFIYVDGSVNIIKYMIADINGDEKINSKDATYLLRYLADWDDIGWVEQAMDVNGDGTINYQDATHLLRYLAGWDIAIAE